MKPIHVQMFAFNQEHISDAEKIRTAAKLGYQGVELLRDPDEAVIEALKETGLRCESTHGFTMKDGYAVEEELLHKAGIRYLRSGDQFNFGNREQVLRKAEEINAVGKKLKSQGFTFFYHNHTHEFLKAVDNYLLDILMDNTDPEYFCLQLDCGFAAAVGVDIETFLHRHAGRVKLLHIKSATLPMTPDTVWFIKPNALGASILPPLGEPMPTEVAVKMESTMKYLIEASGPMTQGLADYGRILPLAENLGCGLFIVDRDHSYGSGINQSLQEDLETIRSLYH